MGNFADDFMRNIVQSSQPNGDNTAVKKRRCRHFFEQSHLGIEEEIREIRKNKEKRYSLYNGRRISDTSGEFTYVFESEDETHFPEGIAIKLYRPRSQWFDTGTLLSCDETLVYLSTETDLGENVEKLEFSTGTEQLLQKLLERLDTMEAQPSEIFRDLIGQTPDLGSEGVLIQGAENALRLARNNAVTFIWGPPGTGKTETLAKIALEAIGRGEKVLMVSHSNVSVDGAIERVVKIFEKSGNKITPGTFLRYGYPRSPSILNHPFLTSFQLALYRDPQLKAKRETLLQERRQTDRMSPEFLEIDKKLKKIRSDLAFEESQLAREAKFLAATVSKGVMDGTIYASSFDTVIFDEASMAYIPHVAFAASLAKKHFVCLGDFKQLPPISLNSPFLQTDIFHYTEIARRVQKGQAHPWLCFLETQRRMPQEIADFIGREMYSGYLKTEQKDDSNKSNQKEYEQEAEKQNQEPTIEIIDLTGLGAYAQKLGSSHINILSGIMTMTQAVQIPNRQSVGIIAPYNAQARLIRAMLKDYYGGNLPHQWGCSTVHQFQGSEKEVILYDPTDSFGVSMGLLLKEEKDEYANRLFNVALSRTKNKFIAIVQGDYFQSRGKADLLFKKFLTCGLPRHQGNKIWSGISSNKTIRFYSFAEGKSDYEADLLRAPKQIEISLPRPILSDALSFRPIWDEAEKRGVNVQFLTSILNEQPSWLQEKNVFYFSARLPMTIIDREIIWIGYPNTDSPYSSDISKRPVIRFQGKKTARLVSDSFTTK